MYIINYSGYSQTAVSMGMGSEGKGQTGTLKSPPVCHEFPRTNTLH